MSRGLDLKAEVVRLRKPLYVLAAEARINPGTLSRLLNERAALDPAQEQRICAALARLAAEPAR
jgi:hypothetical protein